MFSKYGFAHASKYGFAHAYNMANILQTIQWSSKALLILKIKYILTTTTTQLYKCTNNVFGDAC